MTNEERATNQVARWVSEARAALGLSRQEFGRLLAGADVPRTAAYRFERHGRIAQEELATVTKILHAALADMERRVTAAGKLLGTVPAATVTATTAKAPAPTKKTAPAPAKKTATEPKEITRAAAKAIAAKAPTTAVPHKARTATPRKTATPKEATRS